MFAVAGFATPARSGPFCAQWGCVPAPYTDVAQFAPGDDLWLVPGLLLVPVFVVLLAAVDARAAESGRLWTRVAIAFATAYAVIVGADSFFQLAVVVPSLQAGETAGLSRFTQYKFTQYNPHGLFIAAEAIGYLAMSLALVFAAPAFDGDRMERAIRWLFAGGSALAIAALAGLWVVGGDLIAFEVAVLSINWIVLSVSGVLLAVLFWRDTRSTGAIPISQQEASAP